MMKYEFEKVAGYEVTWQDYENIIEPMYLATDMSKEEFAKTLNRKRFDMGAKKQKLKKEMTTLAERISDTAPHYTDRAAIDRLHECIKEYIQFYPFPNDIIYQIYNKGILHNMFYVPAEVVLGWNSKDGKFVPVEKIRL